MKILIYQSLTRWKGGDEKRAIRPRIWPQRLMSLLADVNIQSSVDESSFEVKTEADSNDIGIKIHKSIVNHNNSSWEQII